MSDNEWIVVETAKFPQDHKEIASLFTAYVEWLEIDLTYQNYNAEFASLPGKYSQTAGGALLVARHKGSGQIIGCVALRALDPPAICELKRLYVAPEGRGSGAGTRLLEEAIISARNHGYSEMKLDTLPKMGPARKMYKKYGFNETLAYYNTPIKGTIFMSLDLKASPV